MCPIRQNEKRGKCSARASRLLALLFLLLPFIATSAFAQQVHPTESQVKAAYLYNFGKFVRWPTDHPNADSMAICILGKDPFGEVLDSTVEGASIDGRKITVKRLVNAADISKDIAPCSILFVSISEEGRLAPLLAAAQRQGLLTVSDIPHFAEHGGIIGLVMQENKIRFEVNRGAAEQSHVALSSELLKVAVRVIEKPPQS